MSVKNYKYFKPQEPSNITFMAAKDEFGSLQRIYGVVNSTMQSYEQATKIFIGFAGVELKCKDISFTLLENYKEYLTTGSLKKATINNYLKRIGTIIKFGVSRGYIPNDFIIPIVKN